MYPTRSSARIQSEKDAEHNNQLLSFFNDFFKITLKLSVINDEIIGKSGELSTNTVNIKEKDLDKVMSSKDKKDFFKTMNNVYSNIKTMCYSSLEEQIRKEEEMKRKKIEDKLNKKIESLKKDILTLKQNDLSENTDKSINTSQFKKELVQLSLLYKDDKDVEEYTEIFENVRYHQSFINELYLNSKEKLKQGLGKDRKSIITLCESMEKEIELIHQIMDNFMIRMEMCQNKIEALENSINNNNSNNNNSNNKLFNVDASSGNISSMTVINMYDLLKKMKNYINENKENIDSIPIIQKYTYKNEQDIKEVKTKLDEIPRSNIPSYGTGPILIQDSRTLTSNPNSISNSYGNKRQKVNNENDYVSNNYRNDYNSSSDNIDPYNNYQNSSNSNNMFNNRNRYNRTPSSSSQQFNNGSNGSPVPFNNPNLTEINYKLRELEERLNTNMRTFNNLISQNDSDHINTIVSKFTEINTQLNQVQLSTNKRLTEEVENRLKEFQNGVNNINLNYINEQIKTYNKATIDSIDQSLKSINYQVNIWKKKMTESLESQFGNTIQELKLQILSLSKLPIPENSNEYMTLLDFLKDVFRWNWEKWKIEWTKEFYQCVQCLQKDYIKPLENKVYQLEKHIPTN